MLKIFQAGLGPSTLNGDLCGSSHRKLTIGIRSSIVFSGGPFLSQLEVVTGCTDVQRNLTHPSAFVPPPGGCRCSQPRKESVPRQDRVLPFHSPSTLHWFDPPQATPGDLNWPLWHRGGCQICRWCCLLLHLTCSSDSQP